VKQSPLRYFRNGAVALVKAKGLSAVIEERLRTELLPGGPAEIFRGLIDDESHQSISRKPG
jgi:hypothetical protein